MFKERIEESRFSILVPVLNERKNLGELLDTMKNNIFGRETVQKGEITFIDGGSSDGSLRFLKKAQEEYPFPLRVVECGERESDLSSDLLEGAKNSRGDILVVTDGDLSHPPRKIPVLLEPIFKGEKDMMVGSRYMTGGTTRNWSLVRRSISRLLAKLSRLSTSVHDPLSGFFAIKRKFFFKYGKENIGFKIGFEILMKAHNEIQIGEIPIHFRGRRSGRSKLGLQEAFSFLSQFIRLNSNKFINKFLGTSVTDSKKPPE